MQKIITLQRLDAPIGIINKIKSAENELHLIISSYTTNNETLLDNLDAFIAKARADRNGFELVSCLDTTLIAASPLVDDLIKHGREYIEETRWSTTALMYNIYLIVTMYMYRENGLLETAVRLKGNVSRTNVTEDLNYCENRLKTTKANLFQSMRNVGHNLNVNDSVQLLNLKILSDDKIVRMKNFLQLFYDREQVLANANTCTGTCEDYSNVGHHRNGCFGTARDCKYVDTHVQAKVLTYQKPQVDRIYTNVGVGGRQSCELKPRPVRQSHNVSFKNIFIKIIFVLQGHFHSCIRGFVICHICECICDQHHFENTTRRFYSKTIAAPPGQ